MPCPRTSCRPGPLPGGRNAGGMLEARRTLRLLLGSGPVNDLLAPPPGEIASPDGAVPTLSAAEALAATPFFGELSAVDLARLVPDLEEYQFPAGATVYAQGD